MRKTIILILCMVLCFASSVYAGPPAYSGSSSSGTGDVTGPASATDSNAACFDGTGGKTLKDCGVTAGGLPSQTGNAGKLLTTDASTASWTDIINISSIDLSSGTLKVPNAAAPTVDASGKLALDTTEDQLLFYGGALRAITYKLQKDFVIKAPVDTDDFLLFKAQFDMTLSALHCVAQGSTPSAVIKIQECDGDGANCADSGLDVTADGSNDADISPSDAAVDAGDWVKVLVDGAPTGTVTFVTCALYYTVTRK